MANITAIYLIIFCSLTSAMSLRRQAENEESSQLMLQVGRLLQNIESERELDEYCASVRQDCVITGEIFKRNLVCASNLKRYLNPCHLQLRSCDLKRETGKALTEERCLWVNVESESGSASSKSGDKSRETGSTSEESGGNSKESGGNSKESGGKSNKSGGSSDESEAKERSQ